MVPVEGEVPSLADLDLAWVGLGASSKAPLPLGKAGPLEPRRANGEGLISSVLFLLFISPFFCVIDVFFLFFFLRKLSVYFKWVGGAPQCSL